MILRKTMTSIYIATTVLLMLQSCNSNKAPSSQGGFYHSNIYFGKHFSPDYQQGIADGCKTAKGHYRKLHKHFMYNRDYYNGWFLGRNRCKHLLKINENGDLIS